MTMKMNQKGIRALGLLLAVLALATLSVACRQQPVSPWDSAVYTSDAELGVGEKTLTLELRVEDRTLTFTVHTDQETVGQALVEQGLIAGEMGTYGLYIKTVNGMLADYDVDGSYWAFYINGEYAMTGVDSTHISEQDIYALVREK